MRWFNSAGIQTPEPIRTTYLSVVLSIVDSSILSTLSALSPSSSSSDDEEDEDSEEEEPSEEEERLSSSLSALRASIE